MLWHFLCGKSKGFSILKFSQETSQNPFLSTPPLKKIGIREMAGLTPP